jgi:tRNA-specific adenosine deaminase 3
LELQHLRRFAKVADLPQHLREALTFSPSQIDDTVDSETLVALVPTLYMLLGSTKTTSYDELKTCLAELMPSSNPRVIKVLPVPLLAPKSTVQASEWSAAYWPTMYKKSNPFGPHPSIVERAEADIRPWVGTWLSLAKKVAIEGSRSGDEHGIGEEVGAVIVDPRDGKDNVDGGDYLVETNRSNNGGKREGSGIVAAHAALRAIGMVARKLKAQASGSESPSIIAQPYQSDQTSQHNPLSSRSSQEETFFLDGPILQIEESVFNNNNISASGYLCHGLEIYLTHEPCVMCSMAILHSRFTKVVFAKRMAKTGGLCAEVSGIDGGLGYGMWWRKELNWNLLAWQFVEDATSEATDMKASVNEEVHA